MLGYALIIIGISMLLGTVMFATAISSSLADEEMGHARLAGAWSAGTALAAAIAFFLSGLTFGVGA